MFKGKRITSKSHIGKLLISKEPVLVKSYGILFNEEVSCYILTKDDFEELLAAAEKNTKEQRSGTKSGTREEQPVRREHTTFDSLNAYEE